MKEKAVQTFLAFAVEFFASVEVLQASTNEKIVKKRRKAETLGKQVSKDLWLLQTLGDFLVLRVFMRFSSLCFCKKLGFVPQTFFIRRRLEDGIPVYSIFYLLSFASLQQFFLPGSGRRYFYCFAGRIFHFYFFAGFSVALEMDLGNTRKQESRRKMVIVEEPHIFKTVFVVFCLSIVKGFGYERFCCTHPQKYGPVDTKSVILVSNQNDASDFSDYQICILFHFLPTNMSINCHLKPR